MNIAPALQHWLGELLRERISAATQLRLIANKSWEISAAPFPGRIIIPAQPEAYARLTASLAQSAAMWNPVDEGWEAPLGLELPAPGASGLPSPLISPQPDGYHFGFDLLWFAVWALSRAEEPAHPERDRHDRFPASASHAFQHDYLHRPLVDEWFAVIRQVVGRLWPSLPLVEPHFKIALSHDVDEPRLIEGLSLQHMLSRAAGDVLRRKRPRRGLEAPFRWLALKAGIPRADPFDTFAWIMSQAEQRQLCSTFHFLCGHTDARFDRTYRLSDPCIRDLLIALRDREHRIALHPSYGSYRDAESISREASHLRQTCAHLGIPCETLTARMHYLRWSTPETPRALAHAQVATDCTLGYAEQVGFRCGTCFAYRAFDPVAIEPIDLRIQPLIAMDVTFLPGGYLNLNATEALALLSRIKNACRAVGGTFSLCWHNSELDTAPKRALFEAVLDA